MYTPPPLSFTGVNILVRFKPHGLFPGNGCILELLALAVYIVDMLLCLCCSRKWMWMSCPEREMSKLTDNRSYSQLSLCLA